MFKVFDFLKQKKKQARPKSTLEETIEGIPLKFKKHHASKQVKISIRQNAPVLVTLPKRMSYIKAKEFAMGQMGWIKANVKGFNPTHCPIAPLELKKLRKEAKERLPKRLEELAHIHGFKYRNVYIKNLKTRWGSCSFLNNINLNLSLMRLEPDLVDYVLLHELVHTVEKNHGPKFWALLESILPNAKELRRRLKKSSCSI